MRRNVLTILVSVQSVIIGLWLAIHNGKENYTNEVQGFEHTKFLNSPYFYIAAILIGGLLLFSVIKEKEILKRWLLIAMNAMWSAYTIVLIINEFSGIPNMSWAILLGYNAAVYLAARYEVDI